jgi:hypothetical protein
MRDFIESLIELDKTELFDRARSVRVQNALTEWQMAAMLMAIERQRAYIECGCSSITVYADKKLGLHPKKTRALLRLARICTYHELVSKAFKDGSLCWTKVREIGRVLDDHNEEKWVKYATTHTVRQVESAVAKPPAVAAQADLATRVPDVIRRQRGLGWTGWSATTGDLDVRARQACRRQCGRDAWFRRTSR